MDYKRNLQKKLGVNILLTINNLFHLECLFIKLVKFVFEHDRYEKIRSLAWKINDAFIRMDKAIIPLTSKLRKRVQ